MKSVAFILALFLACTTFAGAQTLAVNGLGNDGYIGAYDVNGTHYWWLCVEPEGTPAANPGQSFLASDLSLTAGWTAQNTERTAYYNSTPAAQAALAKQINIMEYVLDVYLPIAQLSTPGAVTEDTANPGYYNNDDDFYNRLYAVQNFLSETYGKETRTDFTNLTADYIDRWSGDLTAAGMARSQLFQDILADIEGKDAANFFDTDYIAVNGYYIINTPYGLDNTGKDPTDSDYNWQDVLLIAIPVPEPSGALMIACCGLAVMMRRWRKVAR